MNNRQISIVFPANALGIGLAADGFVRYSDSAWRQQRRCNAAGGKLESTKGIRDLGWASLAFALLQSLCTAVLTISGLRVAIGLGALAASGVYPSLLAFHRDAFRIPMLALATLGAIVNLAVLAWIWRLRAQPSAAWRKRELSSKEKRSERLQVVLAVVTLVLVGLESWSHVVVHRPPAPAGTVRISRY